jgi:hypothetical protein
MRRGASHGEIEGGTKFWRREFCVEKQERMRERERGRRTCEWVLKEERQHPCTYVGC